MDYFSVERWNSTRQSREDVRPAALWIALLNIYSVKNRKGSLIFWKEHSLSLDPLPPNVNDQDSQLKNDIYFKTEAKIQFNIQRMTFSPEAKHLPMR